MAVEQNGSPWGTSRISTGRVSFQGDDPAALQCPYFTDGGGDNGNGNGYMCSILASERHAMNLRAELLSFKVLGLLCRARTWTDVSQMPLHLVQNPC
jgi:hypothetical protein